MDQENKPTEAPLEVTPAGKHKAYTLEKWGNKLPIYNSTLKKNPEFTFLPWDMEMEEKFSALQAKSKNVGEFVRNMMMNILDTYDGQDFQSMKPEVKILTLASFAFADMMYMYIYLRYEELGKELVLDFHCPACKKLINKFTGDLSELDVHVKEAEHNQTFIYNLKSPIILADGEVIDAIEFKVAGWKGIESVPSENAKNQATVKSALMLEAMNDLYKDGKKIDKFVDKKSVIKKIKKYDIEKIGGATADNNAGPEMAIGGKCPHCEASFVKPIEWGYEVFFDSSSL